LAMVNKGGAAHLDLDVHQDGSYVSCHWTEMQLARGAAHCIKF
jgi:hypothetical protein